MTSTALNPIQGPAAWRGDQISQSTEWIYNFSDVELAEVEAAGRQLLRKDPDLRQVVATDFPLPILAKGLNEWAEELDHGRGFILTRGLRVDEYSDALSAAIFYILGLHLGEPMRQNELGDLVDHIRATSNKTLDDPTALGGRVRGRLGFHSDSSDVVALLCLRPAKQGGASSLISGVVLYNEVLAARPDLAPLLFEPWYFDWYKQDHDAPENVYDSPLCGYVDGVFSMYGGSRIIYTAQDYPEVPRLTPQQHELLELIEEITHKPGVPLDMDFQPGDIQWLLNYSAMHSRTEFTDHPEPERRRHLLRMWLKRDTGRPVPERFGRHVVKSRDETRATDDSETKGHFHIREVSIQRPIEE